MKKNLLFMALAICAAFAMTSCSSDDDGGDEPVVPETPIDQSTISVAQTSDGGFVGGGMTFSRAAEGGTVAVEGISDDMYNDSKDFRLTVPSYIECKGRKYTVTEIAYGAFYNLGKEEKAEEDSRAITRVDSATYTHRPQLTSIELPSTLKKIGACAFVYCYNLTEVIIPDGVTEIGTEAFYGCHSLTKVKLPAALTKIEDGVFRYCSSLTEVTIPDGVTEIGNSAFGSCLKLAKVNIPNSVTEIGGEAFYQCPSLPVEGGIRYADTYLAEAVDKEQSTYTIKDGTKWIGGNAFCLCKNLESIVIPNSVTKIEREAFRECPSLTSVEIPNSVTTIETGAFAYCSSLNSIEIPSSMTEISWGMCYNCSGLESVTIPNSVTKIDGEAFYGCTSLTSVVIPSSVTEIEYWAFNSCENLAEVTSLNPTPPTLGESCFGGVLFYSVLKVPAGSVEAYKSDAAGDWRWFGTIVGI